MQFQTIEGINKPISRIVLGTMIISANDPSPIGAKFPYLGREKSYQLLDAVFKLGCNTFDTAHNYGWDQKGASEIGLGLWMGERGNRNDVVIVTKGGIRVQNGDIRVTVNFINEDLLASLGRLQTDNVDLYLVHHDDPMIDVGSIIEVLNEHHAAGRINAFGVSNWTHERIEEANEYAEKRGFIPIRASEPNYGLAEQVENPWGPHDVSLSGPSQHSARSWYVENRIPIFAYSSLARGFFSGRINRDNFDEKKNELDQACLTAYCHEVNFKRLDRAITLAQEKGASVPQIAMAFVIASPLTVFPITGAAKPNEFEDLLPSLQLNLSANECAWLDLEIDNR